MSERETFARLKGAGKKQFYAVGRAASAVVGNPIIGAAHETDDSFVVDVPPSAQGGGGSRTVRRGRVIPALCFSKGWPAVIVSVSAPDSVDCLQISQDGTFVEWVQEPKELPKPDKGLMGALGDALTKASG